MPKFILLNPLNPDDFECTYEEMLEALAEFGAQILVSSDTLGNTVVYAVSDNIDVLSNMCETVDLPGTILEYTAVYDQSETN